MKRRAPGVSSGVEVRRTVRRLPVPNIVIAIDDLGAPPLELYDVSLGGFAVVSATPFRVGLTCQFMFTTAFGQSFPLAATAIHCSDLDTDRFISGWKFRTSDKDASIRHLLQLATQS